MGLFMTRYSQFKEYMAIKKDEAAFSGRLLKRYKERDKKDTEYSEFKNSLIHTIDNLFNQGKTKIVIQPRMDKVKLYEKLVKDEEFNRFYVCEVKTGPLLEISMREL